MLRFAPLLLFALSACSLAGPSGADIEAARSPEAEGVIVNRTATDFIPMAMETSLAARIDIATEFEIRDRGAIVSSGEAAALSIGGYEPGADFFVFVFRVRGDRATYAGGLDVDGGAFERDDAVVTVRRF